MKKKKTSEIRLAHGGGGRVSQDLIRETFLPAFENAYLETMNDSAVLQVPGGRIAFTTDSYTVEPVFFPGGDIGRLAVSGTVNDLCMVGAKPLFLSAGFILEEGFPVESLERIVASARDTAKEAGVVIVTGDTKVVPRGKADGIFINTSGVGCFEFEPIPSRLRSGDAILVNGPLGCHGMAVMTARQELGFKSRIESDVAPLNRLVEGMLGVSQNIHAMRDATRGGLVSVLNEMAEQANVGIELDEKALPVLESVRGACELLGLDPLYVANEGVLVAGLSGKDAEKVLRTMRSDLRGKASCVIGRVVEEHPGTVVLNTEIGSRRILDMLSGEQLPRIC